MCTVHTWPRVRRCAPSTPGPEVILTPVCTVHTFFLAPNMPNFSINMLLSNEAQGLTGKDLTSYVLQHFDLRCCGVALRCDGGYVFAPGTRSDVRRKRIVPMSVGHGIQRYRVALAGFLPAPGKPVWHGPAYCTPAPSGARKTRYDTIARSTFAWCIDALVPTITVLSTVSSHPRR